jgi:hypothetical protein
MTVCSVFLVKGSAPASHMRALDEFQPGPEEDTLFLGCAANLAGATQIAECGVLAHPGWVPVAVRRQERYLLHPHPVYGWGWQRLLG